MRHRNRLKNYKTFNRLVDGSMLPMCAVVIHRPSLRTYYIWTDPLTLRHTVHQRKNARPGKPIWTIRARTKGEAWARYMDYLEIACYPI